MARTPPVGIGVSVSRSPHTFGIHALTEPCHRFRWARTNSASGMVANASSRPSHVIVVPRAGDAHGHHIRSAGETPGGGDHSAKNIGDGSPRSMHAIACSRMEISTVDDASPAVDQHDISGDRRAICEGFNAP